MNAGSKPRMSLRPPGPRPSQEDEVAALQKLSDWTEKRDPPEVGQGSDNAAIERPVVALQVAQAPAQPAPAPAPAPTHPWDVVDSDARVAINYRCPATLAAKMKFLAGTTFGMDVTKLMNQTLEPEIDRQLRARGINV